MDQVEGESDTNLLSIYGENFFIELQKRLRTEIPVLLKNILLVMDIDRALILSMFDKDSVKDVEQFMQNQFESSDMLRPNEQLKDYLGKYVDKQKQFVLSYGHKLMLNAMVRECQNIAKFKDEMINQSAVSTFTTRQISTSDSVVEERGYNSSISAEEIDYEIDEVLVDDSEKSFHLYIGSLIIIIYNDAKRLTLSSWSWPSRHVAAEKAHNYRVSGNPICDPQLNHVTPGNHTDFLDSIVQSDLKNLVSRIKDSLALSLRVDGSVDRTQDHNIYVMGHIVNKDATVSTVFIGFKVPQRGKAIGYYECMKSVVETILPWELCLFLLSSIVTDGEELNLGSKTGLHIRILRAIQDLVSKDRRLLSIWCYPHRINLSWKDTCNECPLIGIIVANAAGLSSFFHKSGKRTFNLKAVAAAVGLQKPLRYVKHFPVRWTEYVFDLLNVTLRNWRASMAYFVSEGHETLKEQWLCYDRIHFMSSDVLRVFKTFQKTFESDTISLFDVEKQKRKLLERLDVCLNGPMDDGWESLFLANVDEDAEDGPLFHGHTLLRNHAMSDTNNDFQFTVDIRKDIVNSLIKHVNERLDYDAELQETLQPLAIITSSTSIESLRACHKAIVPDLSEVDFFQDYQIAANSLREYEFKAPLETLQKLQHMHPTTLNVLKTALARVVAAKPHSADVERLICTYNKIKTCDRLALSGLSLYNFLYIKVNMGNLDTFDPTDAVEHWMKQKNRRPAESHTRKQQEYFKGVFAEADDYSSNSNPIISF